ncbi:MAG: 1-deoxy-D-xylulose-5-phosphate synthase [Faecalibacterium sp.]|jgi:1-deoxy-D-xylulose-5-phosphate synthase|nr:1-deoxy-D-xylulose-5-phosphate synthase [Faecalibacterium sp.]
MDTPLLDKIHQPEDLKKLSTAQLAPLCEEIRSFLLESVAKTGGHLASNLGAIELTVALHRALDTPVDKIVFDVGHQCYTHKILTGRRDRFDTLRQLGGISGFPNPRESEHDAFIAGHGNTALSLALGMARAKQLKGEPGQVYAVIGDGAFTGGMVYEGLNNIDTLDNLVVVLNDNKMSISKNVGAMARYLTRLRTDPEYFRIKENVQIFLDAVPVIGTPIRELLQHGKQTLRRSLYHSTMFEEMGFQYIGPVDGHDVVSLAEMFKNLRHQTAPLFIHVVTTKGKGYRPAEKNPGEFHGVSSFTPDGMDPDNAPDESFSTVFGQKLVELGKKDRRICAITAAMKYGTGLQYFHHACPERFFDVGMAEQHAVTFAAGLASEGMVPVVGIYSTFLQRSYDQIIHDVNLLKENVVFAVDRAGLVPGDGETHQGVYDPAFFSQIGIPTLSPANYAELRFCLEKLLAAPKGPAAVRYPRGAESRQLAALGCTGRPFDFPLQNPSPRAVLVSYGSETEDALKACAQLAQAGILCDCCKLLQIYPLPDGLVEALSAYPAILFAEECITRGGIGEHLLFALQQAGWQGRYVHCGVENTKLTHATVPQLKTLLGLDAAALAHAMKESLT